MPSKLTRRGADDSRKWRYRNRDVLAVTHAGETIGFDFPNDNERTRELLARQKSAAGPDSRPAKSLARHDREYFDRKAITSVGASNVDGPREGMADERAFACHVSMCRCAVIVAIRRIACFKDDNIAGVHARARDFLAIPGVMNMLRAQMVFDAQECRAARLPFTSYLPYDP